MKKTEWMLLALAAAGVGYMLIKGRAMGATIPRAGSIASSSNVDGAYRPTNAGTYSFIDAIRATPDTSPISRDYVGNWAAAVYNGADSGTSQALASGYL